MANESEVSLKGVSQAPFSLPSLGLSSLTTPPHPQPGWSPGTRRQLTIVPCCRSMHSGAMSVVSRRVVGGRSGALGRYRDYRVGIGEAIPELEPHGPFHFHQGYSAACSKHRV